MSDLQSLAAWNPPPRPGPMVLDGRYVRVAPLELSHSAELYEAYAVDDSIWDFLGYGPFASAEDYAQWVARMAGKADPLFFALCEGETGAPSGVASLMRIVPEHGVIEVGHICFAPALQRTRAASEAIFLFADWVFGSGYRRFEWKCDAANAASRRAAERFGFSFEGVFRSHMIVKGRNRDTAWFAMTARDWPALRAAWQAWLDPANFGGAGVQRRPLGSLTSPCRVASDPRP